jgi:hypothetical protein
MVLWDETNTVLMCALARRGHHLLQPVPLLACLTHSVLVHLLACMRTRITAQTHEDTACWRR